MKGRSSTRASWSCKRSMPGWIEVSAASVRTGQVAVVLVTAVKTVEKGSVVIDTAGGKKSVARRYTGLDHSSRSPAIPRSGAVASVVADGINKGGVAAQGSDSRRKKRMPTRERPAILR